jgi:eukaryotic translation initiation factor 2C
MSPASVSSFKDMPAADRKDMAEKLAESAKRSEMVWHAFSQLNEVIIDGIPVRQPKLSNIGQKIPMKLNYWKLDVPNLEKLKLYQYDVKVVDKETRSDTKINRKMKEKAWACPTIQNILEKKGRWLYDGNALAWSLERRDGGIREHIDLGAEEGRGPSKKTSKNHVVVEIKPTRTLNCKELKDMLDGNNNVKAIGWGEMLNVFEHVLHQYPSQDMVIRNKSFYTKNEVFLRDKLNDRKEVGEGILFVRGVYVSFKPVYMGTEANKLIRSLALNVDVANTPFWVPGLIVKQLPKYFRGPDNEAQYLNDAAQAISQAKKAGGNQQGKAKDKAMIKELYNTKFGKVLSKLVRVKVIQMHLTAKTDANGKKIPPIVKAITDWVPLTPKDHTFIGDDKKSISVQDYFLKKYNIRTKAYPMARFGDAENGSYVPLEVLSIAPDQRYNWKLNEQQTSEMLSFAVKAPYERWEGIQHAVNTMNWASDPWLNDYGMKVNKDPVQINNARLLPCPTINFDKTSHPPKTTVTGRWRIDGKKFAFPNELPVGAFGFAIHNQGRYAPQRDQVLRFAKEFTRIYAGHGGRFVNPQAAQNPFIWEGNLLNGLVDFGKGIMQHCAASNGGRNRPVLAFFVVGDRNPDVYAAVKSTCDIRWGTASQVLQNRHVQKCSPQYISNICLKVNAKLGGATCSVSGHPAAAKMLSGPTMIIGADVTHGSVGTDADSIASMTMSRDRAFAKYMGMVHANGKRQEIIQAEPINQMIQKLMASWVASLKVFPDHVIYMRDGVSNQQFYKIVTEEVRDIKIALKNFCHSRGKPETKLPKFTVLCATKRHHTRFFPTQSGSYDQNRNPLPGTLVETGATMATGVDWFLCSHVALKGTARPVHYVLLQNESGFNIETLQQFIFEHCFQYVRSTTPISQHPAIYYAHLAAARGLQHVDKAMVTRSQTHSSDKEDPTRITPLLKLDEKLVPAMWFV